MRTEGALVRGIRGQITMIKWAIRFTVMVCAVSAVYGWLQPKQLVVAHKLVPTYSMMVGE